MSDDGAAWFALFCMIAGLFIGGCAAKEYWKTEIVNHGFAEYNSTNGVWQWKETK